MIKDKLHTISDEDAIEVAKLLLKSPTSNIFSFTFEKISRQEYVNDWGVDAEESVDLHFNAIVKNEDYRKSGWNDKVVLIKLIERDRYHDYPYFTASYKEKENIWKHHQISNHIEAIEFLQKKGLV